MSDDRPVLSALDAIYRRRATRAYTADVVDDATIRILLRAAVHAPTAMHVEPWAFAIIQNRALLRRISDRSKSIVLSGHRELAMLREPSYDVFHGAGTLVAIYGRPAGPFIVADCWLAAQNLMIAATALGYGTCPIGFAVQALDDAEVKAELGIPRELVAVAPIVVGVAAGDVAASPRKDPNIVCWKR